MSKQTCGAPTLKGGLCGNGLGCHHHKAHCQRVIRARAMARITAPEPVQDELFPRLTLAEIRKIVRENIRIGREEIRPASICGCEG